jgi:hypothetical protein
MDIFVNFLLHRMNRDFALCEDFDFPGVQLYFGTLKMDFHMEF